MHMNCADFEYKAMGELIQVLSMTQNRQRYNDS